MDKRYFSDKIVEWYLGNRRPLPWRETTDPYRVWLSEVILQQTRVAQGLPYFHQFVSAFPTVRHLAHADEQTVMRLWQGLGYYTRARNLHQCARVVSEQHGGRFPSTYAELRKLPGIGDYTAAAVASFCFDEPVAVLDGNVYRILSRIFGLDVAINTPAGKANFAALANELLDHRDPATHNQAVMEFGALYCTPANPDCPNCIFAKSCFALRHDLVPVLPVKSPRKKSKQRYFYYVVVEKQGDLLMKRRQSKDIWHGLFDFMLFERNKAEMPENVLDDPALRRWGPKVSTVRVSKEYKHILTHQTIHCRFLVMEAKSTFSVSGNELSFYSREQIASLPKPVLISRFLDEHYTIS